MVKVFLKILLVFLLLVSLCQCDKYQAAVFIPDDLFLHALIEQGIDKNGDGIISPGEAEETTSIIVHGEGISDLTGNKAFVNLDTLICVSNHLGVLDVSSNKTLKFLICDENQLSSLDRSNNPALELLSCGNNLLSTLDVSNNIKLRKLTCHGNPLSQLDVSPCSELRILGCGSTGLTEMVSLHEVCVWTLPFPPEDVDVLYYNSPNVTFTTDCSL